MLKIDMLNLGIYWVNCYIIRDEESSSCCVIDPGGSPKKVLNYLSENSLTLEAILLTHGHFDHVGGVRELAEATSCPVYICAEDLVMPKDLTAGELYFTHTYGEGTVLNLAGLTIHVIHTPGHTPGSVCLLTGNAMFSGDTLFAGSCGRTDLAGGDHAAIIESLHRLKAMEAEFSVFPGHGKSTLLSREKEYNPFMK